jgi:hypothetical protein
MSRALLLHRILPLVVAAVLTSCGGGGGGDAGGDSTPPGPVPIAGPDGPAWFGYARDAQHVPVSPIASQDLRRIAWQTPVDLAPQYTGTGALLAHYGSPVVTTHNTIVIPVKTGANSGFRVEARSGLNGLAWWSASSDYVMPPHSWTPSYNVLLTPSGRLYAPAAGGRLMMRTDAESTTAQFQTVTFYGDAAYNANPTAFNNTVFIDTPLVSDAQGNVYFGFMVTGTNPSGLKGGVARVTPDGTGTWVSAATAAGDAGIEKPAMNSAPALSPDGNTLYVAVNTPVGLNGVQTGYLLALDSTTLSTKAKVALVDPFLNAKARVSDQGTSSPAVASDGRVFFGVLEASFPSHNARGWLLQFNPLLTSAGVPGSFGWDVTPTIIPASMVTHYVGHSNYLLALKYNNYVGVGTGDGQNRLAVIDPNASQPDFILPGMNVMQEVLTVLAPTPDSAGTSARKEWCINTMAADPIRKSVLANNEDGVLYRWNLENNTLDQSIRLTAGLGEAYTPTLVGADGAVYAINNAILFSIRGD